MNGGKIIVDEWGDVVRPYSTHMGRNGGWFQITDLAPDDQYSVGAVFEGGDPEEDGDYFTPGFFGFKVEESKC